MNCSKRPFAASWLDHNIHFAAELGQNPHDALNGDIAELTIEHP